MKIVFMGTPAFSAVSLEALAKSGHEIGYVVTQPDRRGNRGKIKFPETKETALRYGIPVLQPEKLAASPETVDVIREYAPDLIVVVSFGQILKEDVLSIPKYGCINVHASLLPKYRGASPMQRAILDGEKETGITIMKMEKGLDTGDMIAKATVEIGNKNFTEIHDELAKVGAELLLETIPHIEDGTAVYEKQDDSLSTYAGMIRKADGRIDFTEPPEAVERKIRAFDPWPGAYCEYEGEVVKFWRAEPLMRPVEAAPGTILGTENGSLDIACGGRILRVTEAQFPGKKRLPVREILKGKKIPAGDIFK